MLHHIYSGKVIMDYDQEGKKCRACTDFSSWMKVGPKSQQNKTGKNSPVLVKFHEIFITAE